MKYLYVLFLILASYSMENKKRRMTRPLRKKLLQTIVQKAISVQRLSYKLLLIQGKPVEQNFYNCILSHLKPVDYFSRYRMFIQHSGYQEIIVITHYLFLVYLILKY